MTKSLRYMQQEAIDAIMAYWAENNGNPLVDMATGCHAPGTLVLMYDGTTKAVEDVRVGDRLMGPDSVPREVLALAAGREEMYQVTPVKGEPFLVNEGHILSLKTTNSGIAKTKFPSGIRGGMIENVDLRTWLGKAKSWKHLRKLWRTPGVDFPEIETALPVPPWVLGVLIGDGSIITGVHLTNPDTEILDAMCDYFELLGVGWRWTQKPDNKAFDVHVFNLAGKGSGPNILTTMLRDVGVFGSRAENKRVPYAYKCGSKETRLEVLAGLLDTDGHMHGSGFDYISKSKGLSEDVVFISRSLGLAAYMTECEKYCQTGGGGTYWRVSISGDVDRIPTRVERKKAPARNQIKSPLVTGFSVTPAGLGDFYGFALDGDHLYLTADFVVHHNTGKAITLCSLCKTLVEIYSDMRVLVCTHVVELVQQNIEEMIALWPEAPVGIYAASLGRRDRRSQILFAQLQTVWNKVGEIGPFDLTVIDEVHLVPSDGNTMYRKLIDALLELNPDMKICGFTATPYRLDSGRLDEGDDKLFDRVVYEYGIAQGIADGYLTRLTSKPTNTEYDMSGVHRLGGDFKRSELAAAVDKADLTASAVAEIVAAAEADNRQCILAFCTSVEHALHVRDEIRRYGKTCETITGNTPKDERRRIIEQFKRGDVWAVTNDSVMTTGTNVPRVDLIADMAPTESASRYVQKAGRGTRPLYAIGCDMDTAEGRIAGIAAGPKPNCLYMNFAGNVERHGPVDCVVPKKPGKGQGEAPVKLCPVELGGCREIVHASARVCPCCGYEFPIDNTPKISAQASHTPILSDAQPEWYPVSSQTFNFHEKVGGLPSVRIEYRVGMKVEKTWVCPQHSGFAKSKADRWWAQHGGKRPFPASVDEFLDRAGELQATAEVQLRYGGKYNEIVDFRPAPRVEGANDNGVVVRRGAPKVQLLRSEIRDWEDDIPF